ncbi:ankyrin repeat domain-containing protein [Candidatus Jidaibacter acanthamoebae]|uniref:ankyrin repeat domain-containing protein n=1 Tax=Candidatus Jidaibacter acanthamoebae TaxID=86105 RepID=UPI0023BAC501|nr:ankyrin repeat domain-containing protein [Candidatus Jidaibacter acanthamoeba]
MLSNTSYSKENLFRDPLINAANNGDLAMVKKIATSGYPLDIQGEINATALIRAAYMGHTEVVRYLLKKGANPDLQDMGGATALHFAAREGHYEIVSLLIDYSVYGEIPDFEGYTPSMRAILNDRVKAFEALLNTLDLKRKNDKGEDILTLVRRSSGTKIKELVNNKLAMNNSVLNPVPEASLSTEEKVIKNKKNIIITDDGDKPKGSFFSTIRQKIFKAKPNTIPDDNKVIITIDNSFDSYIAQKSSNKIKLKKARKVKITEAVRVEDSSE